MRNKGFLTSCFPLAIVIVGLSPWATAQFGASIQGTIQDNTGAVVTGAKVTVTNQANGVAFTAESGPTGVYHISGLQPSLYTVTVEASSFATHIDKDVQVAAEAHLGFNVQLSPQQASQSVTVTAAPVGAELQTEDANVSGSISAAEVQALPQFGQDPYQLLRLSPGVFGQGAQQANGAALNLPNTTGPGGSSISIFQTENQVPISANGQRLSSNDYLIDGVSVNSQTWGGAAVITPNDDAVQEMRVTSSTYSADTGRNSGATVQVVTKSGGNQFHGDAFFLYQDPGLNSQNGWPGPASLGGTTVAVQNKWREYGGSVGGPVVKNHLFFFFSYEGLHSFNTTYSTPTYIFTQQFDQMASSLRANTFANTMLNAPNSFPRVFQQLTPSCSQFAAANWPCQIVNNELDIGSPTGSDGQYVPVFGTNPAAQAGGGLDGVPDLEYARLAEPVTNIPNQYNLRLDHVHGPHQISWTGLMSRGDQTTYTLSTAPAYDIHYTPFNAATMLAWVWNLSPTWLNDLRGNATRWAYNELNKNTGVNWGLPYAYVQNLPAGVGNVNLSPASSTGTPADFAENTFEVRDTATKIWGQQAIKFGGELRWEQNNDNLAGGDRPAYAFAGPWNLFNDAPIYEGIFINPATGGLAETQRYYRTRDYALFFQDDFKIRPTFTLNIGLRWEYFTPLTEKYGNLSNLFPGSDPTTGLLDAVARHVSQYTNPDYNNFAPRFGFAWSPAALHNSTVLRGGVGMAYNRVYEGILTPSREDPPGGSVNFGLCCGTAGTAGGDGFGTPFDGNLIVLGTSPNSIYGYPVSPNLTTQMPLGPNNLPVPGAPLGGLEIYGAPSNFPNPYVWLYSLEVEHELPAKMIFTIGYQGSLTRKELRLVDQNFIYAQVNPGITNAYFATPDVNGNFNAMNVNLRRNFATWQFAANYRWSKSMDDLSYGGPGAVTNQTYPQDQAFEYGPSDYDSTNYANASVVYRVPFFKNRSTLFGEALSGWTISGIFTYNSGLPWTPVSTQTCLEIASQCLSPYRPSAVLQPLVYSNSFKALTSASNFPGGGAAYFDQTPGVPAVGRNSLRGPSFRSFDMSLGKIFKITEATNVEMRADAFNIFNITNLSPFNFGDPNTVINNPVFGQALTATAGRVLELEGRLHF